MKLSAAEGRAQGLEAELARGEERRRDAEMRLSGLSSALRCTVGVGRAHGGSAGKGEGGMGFWGALGWVWGAPSSCASFPCCPAPSQSALFLLVLFCPLLWHHVHHAPSRPFCAPLSHVTPSLSSHYPPHAALSPPDPSYATPSLSSYSISSSPSAFHPIALTLPCPCPPLSPAILPCPLSSSRTQEGDTHLLLTPRPRCSS